MVTDNTTEELADELARLNAYHSEQFARKLMKIKPKDTNANNGMDSAQNGNAVSAYSIMLQRDRAGANSNSVASVQDSQYEPVGSEQKLLNGNRGKTVKVKRRSANSAMDRGRLIYRYL